MSLWKDNYALGVDQLDSQHRQLLGATEDLLRAAAQEGQQQCTQCKQAVAFLKDYTVVHFQAEEQYMAQTGYPGLEAHRALHREFAENLRQTELELMRQDYRGEAVGKLARDMTRWWMFHIMREDKKIVAAREDGT